VEPRTLEFVCLACGGELLAGLPGATCRRVCTDSRQAQLGDLFFALRGDRFDAHDFLGEVAAKRVAAVVVERAKAPRALADCGVIGVDNPRRALGDLAARYRADFTLPVIAVAGSNGKTTTKELLAAVLRQKFSALWREASSNNDVGVPLTLLQLERNHQAAVLEIGTNHPGELAPLVRMIQPQFGLLTSIGREHLEFFGDVAGVAQEEGWLAELLPAAGKLFLNGDSEWAPAVARRTRASVVRVGFGESNDWRVGQVSTTETGVSCRVHALRREFAGEYELQLLGRHQALNAVLALAAAAELEVSPHQARRGLAECKPAKMRLQIWEAHGVRVLDDAYNANADSMLVALQTLRDLPCAGRRIAVLGDMAELGEQAAAAHAEIGRRAAEMGVSNLVAVGKWARQTAAAARAAGLSDVREFADVPGAAEAVKHLVRSGDLVLLKASRAMGLEQIGDVLRRER